jgi:hypothetical protein
MGLASALLGETNPFAQWLSGNRNTLLGLSSQALSGNWGSGAMQQGRQADDAYATQQKAEAERARQMQETAAWLRQMGQGQIADLIDKGIDPQEAMGLHKATQPGFGTEAPSNVREWEYYNTLTDQQKSEYLRMKRAVPYLDLGTEFAQPDPANPGQIAGAPIKINNEQAAFDKSYGGARGGAAAETATAAESLESKLPGLRAVVQELGQLAQTATYTIAGQVIDEGMRQAGMEPTEAAIARAKYTAMVDNQILPLLRDTFGAQFTVKEGEWLRATLGDPNKSPAEKQAVLEAFIAQKERDLEALRSRVPSGTPAAVGMDDPLNIRGGF